MHWECQGRSVDVGESEEFGANSGDSGGDANGADGRDEEGGGGTFFVVTGNADTTRVYQGAGKQPG